MLYRQIDKVELSKKTDKAIQDGPARLCKMMIMTLSGNHLVVLGKQMTNIF